MTILLTQIKMHDQFRLRGHLYKAKGDAQPNEGWVRIQAARRNPQMPSGWECADILELATAEGELA